MSPSGDPAPPIRGRLIAVTGGATGIGRAIVDAVVERGARVAVIDRDEDAVAALASHLEGGEAGDPICAVGDITDAGDIASWFARIADETGGCYALVNNVGGALAYREFKDLDVDEFDRTLAINLRGAFVCSKAAVDQMLAAGGGRIVNITSIAASRVIPGIVAYSVAKAGMLALTRSMAVELAPHGIAVNAISPGHVLTDASLRVVPDEIREARAAIIPMGTQGAPADIARAAAFLIEDATFLTGAEMMVDGGLSAASLRPM